MRRIVGTAVACVAVATVLAPTSAEARLYYSPTGFWDVRGAIEAEWWRLGGPNSQIGPPLTHETPTPRRVGAFNHFMGGSIYWSPATGARDVRGPIRDTWASLGWEGGHLGFPVTNQLGTPDGQGKYNHFEGGSIYWHSATGWIAHEVRGAIRGRWASLGWETGHLGYPVTNELGTPNGRGRFNHFEGGSIYWSPATGAHDVQGAIRDRWAALGWENSALGFPVTGERVTPDGVGAYNHFQNGSIYWTPDTGAREVRGAIHAAWASMGWENSPLGYPVSDEYAVPGGRRSDFEFGSLEWNPVDGVAADIVLTGSGDAVIPIPPGQFAVEISADSSGETVVETTKPSWSTANSITSGVGSWSRTSLANLGRQAATGLRITTDGDWTVGLLPLSALPVIGADEVAAGSEGTVLRYQGPPGLLRFDAGDPNSQVRIFTGTGAYVDLLWSYGGSNSIPVGGDLILEVRQVDVPWSLVVEPY